jgi:Ca2+-binding RTX toxin-like protein
VPSGALLGPVQTDGPYTGVGVGLLDRYRHTDNGNGLVADSFDVYRGRFTYSFRIDSSGNVEGRGDGVYLGPTNWRLRGTNEGKTFSCSIPMRTTRYEVRVQGNATAERIRLRFVLEGAREANDEKLCGANFYGFATDDTRLANSLEIAQPADGLTTPRAEPALPTLSKLEVIGDDSDRRVILHEWSFSIRAPGAPPPPPPPGPGTGGGGPTPQVGSDCTITGTPGNDTLRGTAGRDVICGLAGNDVIRGLGGHDSLRGGPGNDRLLGGGGNDAVEGDAGTDTLLGEGGRDFLLARDRTRDSLDGGSQRDWAVRDRTRDRVRNVEVLG